MYPPMRAAHPCAAKETLLFRVSLVFSFSGRQVAFNASKRIFFKIDADPALDVEALTCRDGVNIVPAINAKRVDVHWLAENEHDLPPRHAGAQIIDHALSEYIALVDRDLMDLRDAEFWQARRGNAWHAAAARKNQAYARCEEDEFQGTWLQSKTGKHT